MKAAMSGPSSSLRTNTEVVVDTLRWSSAPREKRLLLSVSRVEVRERDVSRDYESRLGSLLT